MLSTLSMQLRDYLAANGGAIEMARKLGVTPEAVRLWASGARIPKPKHMTKIDAVTGGQVTYRDFYEAA